MRQWLVVLALSAVTLLAYSNSFSAGFAFDNKGLLLQDPRIREATAQNIGLIFQRTYWWPYGESGLYRPITTLTYLFNYSILGNGDQPAGYHGQANGFGFADGHAEIHKWLDGRTAVPVQQTLTYTALQEPANSPDWQWTLSRTTALVNTNL